MAQTHTEKMKSGMALEAFMDAFLARRKLPAHFKAQFRIFGDPCYRGSVNFKISKRDVSNFAMLDCDSNVMRSFDVNYGNFDPNFQRFSFDQVNQELRISDSGYDFVLTEIKSNGDR